MRVYLCPSRLQKRQEKGGVSLHGRRSFEKRIGDREDPGPKSSVFGGGTGGEKQINNARRRKMGDEAQNPPGYSTTRYQRFEGIPWDKKFESSARQVVTSPRGGGGGAGPYQHTGRARGYGGENRSEIGKKGIYRPDNSFLALWGFLTTPTCLTKKANISEEKQRKPSFLLHILSGLPLSSKKMNKSAKTSIAWAN